MESHQDFHDQMVFLSLAFAVCTAIVMLVFLFWIGLRKKRGSRDANRHKGDRPARKKRRK